MGEAGLIREHGEVICMKMEKNILWFDNRSERSEARETEKGWNKKRERRQCVCVWGGVDTRALENKPNPTLRGVCLI